MLRNWRPHGDSNPGLRRERAPSWASRRWGPGRGVYLAGRMAASKGGGQRLAWARWKGPPHPASAKLAPLAKPTQPSPSRGEGKVRGAFEDSLAEIHELQGLLELEGSDACHGGLEVVAL